MGAIKGKATLLSFNPREALEDWKTRNPDKTVISQHIQTGSVDIEWISNEVKA
jgi:hypothetical protein